MKISCQSCQAKYTIADDKVLGKIVKIRCKKCSSTIVINGNESGGASENVEAQVFDQNEQWMVNVADGDQRTMNIEDLVREYQNGVVNDDTFCWKDGMADWLPIREVESLYAAVTGGRDEAYSVAEDGPSSSASPLFGNADYDQHGGDHGAGAALFGAADPAPAETRAARVGGRAAGGADLFGDAALAGGEDFGRSPPSSDPKMTGSRNENSVLFSLSALTSDGKPEASSSSRNGSSDSRTTAQGDGSGLIDIKALANSMGDSDRKKDRSQVDDIMNLSGGGAFGTSALAAPILAPPPMDTSSNAEGSSDGSKNNKNVLFGLLGGGALVAIGLVVAVVMMKQPTPTTTPQGANSGAASTTVGDPAATATLATNPTAAATPAAPTGAEPKNPLANPGTAGGAAKTGGATAAATPKTGGGGGSAVSPPAGGTAAVEPAQPAQPTSLGAAMAQAAGAKTGGGEPAAAAGSGPFDRGAAAAALSGVNVASCKKGDGPTGSGHVTVIFAPNGSVKSATVDSAPFEGTPVGGCIAGKFRAAHVPAFSGGEVKVGKSFSLN